jgi:hypothetical protein
MKRKDSAQLASIAALAVKCVIWLVLLLIVGGGIANAQSVWAEAGTSTMFRASGFEVNYRWAPVQGWASASWSEGFHVGGFLQTRIKDYSVGAGDWYQPMVLDTDVFDQSRYFAGRGITVQHGDSTRNIVFFAGATTGENSSTFYRTFEPQTGVGGVFLEQKLGRSWKFHSMNLVQSDGITSIQSVHYQASDRLDFSAAGGVGNNSPYFSLGSRYLKEHWQLIASYTSLGAMFQRVTGVLTNAPERVGANVHLTVQPKRNFQFSLGHDNLLSPTLVVDLMPQRVSLDSVNASGSIKGFYIGGGMSYSKSGRLTARSENFGVSRKVRSNIMASGTLMRIENNSQTANILIGTVQEKITPRLTLNQGMSSQTNNRSFTWGAHWIGNQFTVGIQQDVLYTPLAGGFNGKPYTSMWTVNLLMQLPHSLRVHADSFIDPSGKVRYTTWVDGIGMSRNGEVLPQGNRNLNANFARFVVTGIVQDEQAKPVWGIAVQVDGQTAFTDNSGHFFLRFRKGLTYPVAILPSRGLNPQYYEVVQAPVSATAETEDVAHEILIVVRRANTPVKLRSDTETPEQTTTSGNQRGGLNQ